MQNKWVVPLVNSLLWELTCWLAGWWARRAEREQEWWTRAAPGDRPGYQPAGTPAHARYDVTVFLFSVVFTPPLPPATTAMIGSHLSSVFSWLALYRGYAGLPIHMIWEVSWEPKRRVCASYYVYHSFIGLRVLLNRDRVCRPFWEPRNRFPAWRDGTATLFVVPARQAT